MNCLHQKNFNLTKTNNLLLFSGLKASFYNVQTKKINRCRRSLITYAYNIAITTNNSLEINILIERVSQALQKFGLTLAIEKNIIIKYQENIKCKFEYFGFTFLYVPKNKLKLGGIVKQGKTIGYRLNVSQTGTHLVYPSNNSFKKIKDSLTLEINNLSKDSVTEVINRCNRIILGWTNYFS